jgi:hypothetical protein
MVRPRTIPTLRLRGWGLRSGEYEEGTTAMVDEEGLPHDVQRLCNQLPSAQINMLKLVLDAHTEGGEWPFFAWVESKCDEFHWPEATTILSGFPSVRMSETSYYAAVNSDILIRPAWWNSEVRLTALGIWHLAQSNPRLDDVVLRPYFAALDCFSKKRRGYEPPKRELGRFSVDDVDVLKWLEKAGHNPDERLVVALLEADRPSGVTIQRPQPGESEWSADLDRYCLGFDDIRDMPDYLTRRIARRQEVIALSVPVVPSPLDLVTAVDYLNFVWRVAYDAKSGPFRFPSAERVARLSHDVGTPEEFVAAMSAVGDLIKSLDLRGFGNKHPCDKLEAQIQKRVPSDAHDSVKGAVDILRAALLIRNAGQHSQVGTEAMLAWQAFGLTCPPADWPTAWNVIRARLIDAVDVIRRELSLVDPPDDG